MFTVLLCMFAGIAVGWLLRNRDCGHDIYICRVIELHIGDELAHDGVYAEGSMGMDVYENIADGLICVMIGEDGKRSIVNS